MDDLILETNSNGIYVHHWLVTPDRSVAISYAKILVNHDSIALVEIETRLEFQHYGYATELIKRLEEHYCIQPLPSAGDYTLDGYHFIRPRVDDLGPHKGILNSMNFVRDWDARRPVAP